VACLWIGKTEGDDKVKKKFSKSDLKDFKKIVMKKKEELLGDLKHISDDTLRKSQK
jgi:hypothetical protein